MDFARVDPARLAVVDAIVTEVLGVTGADPGAILLIGAEARDVLHAAQGHTTALRGTTDVDIGIALSGWSAYEGVRQAFVPVGHTGIRFRIADMAVDVVPFGGVEDPRGLARPRGREDEAIVVFGFVEVMRRAWILPLPSGVGIRVPRVEGYAALKMRAWIDRSPDHEEKDADDLALALHWYLEDPDVLTRAWEEGERLDEADGDVTLVIASLLGSDVAAALSDATPPGSRTHLELPLYGASWQEAMRRFFLKYATFRGRASRGEFWWWILTSVVGTSALQTLSSVNADRREPLGGLGFLDELTIVDSWSAVLAVLQLAVSIPSLAVSWRRLHDVDRSGTWTFITFIPILGLIVYVVMTAGRSRPGGARFD